ncbi:MAG: twin-arginine translocase TatA/TatE family subunit [Solirubrobacteraceae bacterium]|jgi:sec-independent protein translocase protein TatA
MFRNPTTDLIVILVIVLLIFGPKRLPGLGRQLGQGIREFKESVTGESQDDQRLELTEANQPVAPPASAAAEPVVAPQPVREPAERGS